MIRAEEFYNQTFHHALEIQKSGKQAGEILNYLASAAEKASGIGTVTSILLLDKDGLLRNGASPQLPDDYLEAIDGIKPDANVGTCAAAAATGLLVITPSFYEDHKWAELRHLPMALGFIGAWSMPIKPPDNKVIGTFGTYFREKREPSAREIKGIELLAAAVAIVLAGKKNAVI